MADREQLLVGHRVRLRVPDDYPDDPQEVGHVMSVDQNDWGMSYIVRVLPEHAMDADDDLYREVMDEDVAEVLGFDQSIADEAVEALEDEFPGIATLGNGGTVH